MLVEIINVKMNTRLFGVISIQNKNFRNQNVIIHTDSLAIHALNLMVIMSLNN